MAGCGVSAVVSQSGRHSHIVPYLALTMQRGIQNRGFDTAGMTSRNGHLSRYVGFGTVDKVFPQEDMTNYSGDTAIAHNRYTTSAEVTLENAQPVVAKSLSSLEVHVAHNGEENIPSEWLANLPKTISTEATSDTGKMAKILAHAYQQTGNVADAVLETYNKLHQRGMASIAIILRDNEKDEDYLVVWADGGMPLTHGTLDTAEDTYQLYASETHAFDKVDALGMGEVKRLGEVVPGTILVYDLNASPRKPQHMQSPKTMPRCFFNLVYKMRSDSEIAPDVKARELRVELGRQIIREHPFTPTVRDVITYSPNSGITYGEGMAKESGLPLSEVLIKVKVPGIPERSFIGSPTEEGRKKIVDTTVQIHPDWEDKLWGRIVHVGEDSVVRGNAMKRIVKVLKNNGADEVHIYSAGAPPIVADCRSGVDMQLYKLLAVKIAHMLNGGDTTRFVPDHREMETVVPTLPEYLGLDSLKYISLEGLERSIEKVTGVPKKQLCFGCITTDHPYEAEGLVTEGTSKARRIAPRISVRLADRQA